MDENSLIPFYVVFYIISISLSIYLLGFVPGRGRLGKLDQFRVVAAVIGFLPCAWIGVLTQIIAVVLCVRRGKELAASVTALDRTIESNRSRPAGNPFSEGAAPESNRPVNGEGNGPEKKQNPFL